MKYFMHKCMKKRVFFVMPLVLMFKMFSRHSFTNLDILSYTKGIIKLVIWTKNVSFLCTMWNMLELHYLKFYRVCKSVRSWMISINIMTHVVILYFWYDNTVNDFMVSNILHIIFIELSRLNIKYCCAILRVSLFLILKCTSWICSPWLRVQFHTNSLGYLKVTLHTEMQNEIFF